MEGGVEFVACDMPHANRLTLHLLAAIAEHEREMISQRTKAALAAAKARGVKLGNPNGSLALNPHNAAAVAASRVARQAKALAVRNAVAPLLSELKAVGLAGAGEIARELNRRGVPSPAGGIWYPQMIRRMEAAA